ncbi:hypothetical protein HYX14_03505 [Candidatus Woesearchaeota archaeon]|nr:hypothetical protein [Candidatus Woesearchaeota archaeon]
MPSRSMTGGRALATFDKLVPQADYIYMTRIQNEHGGEAACDPEYVFTKENLEAMKAGAILMHPGPKREEIDPAIDYLRKDPRVMYWRQQRNGMWVRAALLAYIFKRDDQIQDRFETLNITKR